MLTLGAEDLHVKVCQATGCGQSQFDHALDGDGVVVQVVEERAVLVIVWHQPELSPGAVIWEAPKSNTGQATYRCGRTFEQQNKRLEDKIYILESMTNYKET